MNLDRDPSARLAAYVGEFNARLRRMHAARAGAAAAMLALLLTLGGVAWAIQRGFASTIVNFTRAALLLGLALIALLLWWRPWQRLKRAPSAAIEALAPAFDGRIDTWRESDGSRNPLHVLLAEDALEVAARHPVEEQVRRTWLLVPAAIAVLALGVLVWFAAAGPGLYRYGVRQVWAGWAVNGLVPDQSLRVTPGNQAVRRGGSVPVLATARGFEPARAQLFARIGEGGWQQVDMTRSKRGFEFTLLSVREPVQYYVQAAGVRSPDYRVDVVEVPTIQNLKVSYDYPAWTHRKRATEDPGGDIAGVGGTGVQLEISTDRPIGAGVLVRDGHDTTLESSGNTARTGFTIEADGRYYLAARVGSETVRLSDDYLIKLTPDNKPDVKIVKPGRDWNASSIEEVAAHVQANDDFALEKVELHYAVNGGEWQSVPLPGGGERVDTTHLMMLENLRVASENRALAAGDVVSYYASARDRSQTAQTDMFFVQVRPYDRKFTQSQEEGGGGGGGGDEGQTEISRRQKEILVSTWNLIRQQSDARSGRGAGGSGAGERSAGTVKDNSRLLSDVQQKLAAQAESLANRAEARALTASSGEVKKFIDLMKDAAKSMQPAAQRLASVDLEKAIQPEQLALQYLLRAESVFTDMEMSMQRGGQDGNGGRGGGAGNDLAQLYDLEMDLKKNQYESASAATPGENGAQQQKLDEAARKLEELARRQEQLAREAQRSQQITDEQRWQQEALRREAEQIQQQLADMQRQQNGPSSQSGSQSGSQSAQANAQGGAAGGQSAAAQARQQVDQALSAMNRANEALRNSTDPNQQQQALQRAASEAGRQLSGASRQLSQQRAQTMREQVAALNEQAERAYNEQAASEQQLQGSASAAAGNRGALDGSAGLAADQRRRIASDKRALADQVQRMEQELAATARRWRSDSPQTADKLSEAGQLLSTNQVQEQLGQSAQYIERGLGAFVVPRESGLTDTMREVRDLLRTARGDAQGESSGRRSDRDVQESLARVQSLRQQLQQLANARATGQGQGQGQGQGNGQGSSQSGSQGNGQATGQGTGAQPGSSQVAQNNGQNNGQNSAQNNTQTGAQTGAQSGAQNAPNGQAGGQGQATASGQPGGGGGGGGLLAPRGSAGSPPSLANLQQGLGTTGRQVGALGPALRAQGVDPANANAIAGLARQLQGTSLGGNAGSLDRQLQTSLTLLEQLEVQLARSAAPGGARAPVRTTVNEQVTDEYRDAVAEYYRQLSRN